MVFPQVPDKVNEESVFNPLDLITFNNSTFKKSANIPSKTAILCYQSSLIKYIIKKYHTREIKRGFGDLYLLKDVNEQIAVIGNFGIGAPITIALVEELHANGINNFLSIGIAGSLQDTLCAGDIIICNKAIRDEGTSHHYISNTKYAYASTNLVNNITKYLNQLDIAHYIGSSWTIDAPFRETAKEILFYKQEGVFTVDMEASALFTLGKYRNISTCALFIISDSIANLVWKPCYNTTLITKKLCTLFDLTISFLKNSTYEDSSKVR